MASLPSFREPSRSAWRFGVPVVCLLAGLLLAATHGVSGGSEIRRSDAPRLVDLVREAQQSVDRLSCLSATRWCPTIDNHHGGSPGADAALAAITNRSAQAGRRRGPGPDARAGPRRHAQRRAARRRGPLPARRLPRRPGGAPAGHRGGAQRAVERGRRGHPDAGSADHRHLGAAMRRQHAVAQRPHLQPAVRHHRDRRRRRHAGRAGGGTVGDALQAVRRAVRVGLHRRTQRRRSSSSGTPSRCGCASPSRPARSATERYRRAADAQRVAPTPSSLA